MSGFLLDTNCVSELVRTKPEPRVMEWIEAADEGLLYLSVLTLGEIRKGVAALAQSKRRTHLETWLEVDLQARFSGRIVPIDSAIADRWGLLAAEAKRTGKTLSIIGGLLAPLSSIVEWLRERRYLPIRGTHFSIQRADIRIGKWATEWYAINSLIDEPFLPL